MLLTEREKGEGKQEENLVVLVWPQATAAAAEQQLQSGQVKLKLQKSVRVRRVLEQETYYFYCCTATVELSSERRHCVALQPRFCERSIPEANK